MGASPGSSLTAPTTSLSYPLAKKIGLADPFKCIRSLFKQVQDNGEDKAHICMNDDKKVVTWWYQKGGVSGCYRGLLPQAFRDIKASGLYFLIYEVTTNNNTTMISIITTALFSVLDGSSKFVDWKKWSRRLGIFLGWRSCRGSLLAGGKFYLNKWTMSPSQAIIYLDVVKSRVQADDPLRPLYKGTLDCVRQSYKRSSSE